MPVNQKPILSQNDLNKSREIPLSVAIDYLFLPSNKCAICLREMQKHGCLPFYYIDIHAKKEYCAIPYGLDNRRTLVDFPSECVECSTPKGEYHHFRCREAVCPRCSEQNRNCQCNWREYHAELLRGGEMQTLYILERYNLEGDVLAAPDIRVLRKVQKKTQKK